MIYELPNWSNSATAADVSSRILTGFSRTGWPRPFRAATPGEHVLRAEQNVYRYQAKRQLVGAFLIDLCVLNFFLRHDR